MHEWRGPASASISQPTSRRQKRCAPPSAPCSIDPPTACARRKWLANSRASTRDPRFSRSLARSLPTVRPACGRERWRRVSPGASLASGELIVDPSEGGKSFSPPSEKYPKQSRILAVQIQPASFAFTLLLGFLAAVPYSGIDINLPALAATSAMLGVSPSEVGLTMSAFMLSLAVAPLFYGPISDRFGRKPVVVFGVALFVVASLACAVAQSLPWLLICRFVQGVGAASTAMTFAIVRDLFGETTARAKIANVVIAINVVTVIAPTAGAALLTIGSWRLIYAIQSGIGALLLFAVLLGFAESAKINPADRSMSSRSRSRRARRSTPSSTITPPISIPTSADGSNAIRDGRSISHRHRLPGSTRSRASSRPSQSAGSSAASFALSPTCKPQSTASSKSTTTTQSPSLGPPIQTKSSPPSGAGTKC